MVLPKEAPFKEVKESAAQIENWRARALRTCRGSPAAPGLLCPLRSSAERSKPKNPGGEQVQRFRSRERTGDM